MDARDAIFSGDYYEVLGVQRGAEERDVKRAYFRLVRKYNPESQPEEFKKIREAYEVLANTVSRKDYDGLTQWGDEIGARMKAGSSAMERADYRTAQAEFKHVLVLQPQLAFARDLLGMAYLNAGQAREALTQFDMLVAQQPNNSVYHLHKGYAHYGMQQYAQAAVAYNRAIEIDPADTRVRIALADCYTDTANWNLALEQLELAIQQDGEVNYQDFVFLMRKVQVQLLRDRPDLAEKDLDQIVSILPPDGESRKYVATKLASLAAQMFRVKRSADGNRLIARAQKLDNRKSLELQFPAKATLQIRDLPPASQTTLAAMKKNWTPSKITHRTLVGPTLIAITAAFFGLIALYNVTSSDAQWADEGKFFMFLFLVGVPLLGALAVRRLRRVTKSPFGKFTEVTPLYLLQVDIEKVTAWPLPNLHDVGLTHHLQNGMYQSTSVRMDFGGVPLTVSIRGQQAAVDWAQHVLDTRHRTLALMSDGLLDSEDGLDLIPPQQLAGTVKSSPAVGGARRALLTYGATAAAASLFFFAGAVPLNRMNAEHAAWNRATGWGASLASYRSYLEEHPDGAHAANAKTSIAAFYDDAKHTFATKGMTSPGAVALGNVFDALRDVGGREVKIAFRGETPAGISDYNAERFRSRGEWFSGQLKQAFSSTVANDVMSITEAPTGDVPATLEVSYKVTTRPESTIYKGKYKSVSQLCDFDFAMVVGGLDKYHYKLSTARVAGGYDDEEIQQEQVRTFEQATDEFGKALARDLGVEWPASAPSYNSNTRSNNLLGNTYDPDTQRRLQEILDQLKER